MVWDLHTGLCIKTYEGHTDEVASVAVTPDARFALTGSADRTVRVWDLGCETAESANAPISAAPRWVAVTSNGGLVIAPGPANAIDVWDGNSAKRLRSLSGHTAPISALTLTPDDRHVLSAGRDGTLRLWELQTGKELMSLACGKGKDEISTIIDDILVTADGRYAAVMAFSDIRILDLSTRVWLKRVERGSFSGRNSLTPDGRFLVCAEVGGSSSILVLYDCDGERIKTLLSDANFYAHDLAISPDGRWCAAIGARSLEHTLIAGISLWNLDTGTLNGDCVGHCDSVRCLALMPSGRQFLSGGSDGSVRVWDFAGGRLVTTLRGRSAPVTSIDAAADERFVVAASSDQMVQLWDQRSGKCVAAYRSSGGDAKRIIIRYPFLLVVCENGLLDFLQVMRPGQDGESNLLRATAFRAYRMGTHGHRGTFDTHLGFLCPYCGRHIAVGSRPERPAWLKFLRNTKGSPKVANAQLGRPVRCPHDECQMPVVLNPFVYDGLRASDSSDRVNIVATGGRIADLLRVELNRKVASSEVQSILDRGTRWETMSRWSDAIRCYSIGIEVCGRDPELLFRLGTAYAHDPAQLDAAHRTLEEAYESQAERRDLLHNLGVVLIELGQKPHVDGSSAQEGLCKRGVELLNRLAAMDRNDDLEAVLLRLGVGAEKGRRQFK
jgi:WD40 repeat protein